MSASPPGLPPVLPEHLPLALGAAALRRRHVETLTLLLDRVQVRLDDPVILSAATDYFGEPVRDAAGARRLVQAHDATAHFYPWLLWDAYTGHEPLGVAIASEPGGAWDTALVQALADAPPRPWRVEDARHGHVSLVPLEGGAPQSPYEPIAAQALAPGMVLIARVPVVPSATEGPIALLDAVHLVLPVSAAQPLAHLWSTRRALDDAAWPPPRADALGELLRVAGDVARALAEPAHVPRHVGAGARAVGLGRARRPSGRSAPAVRAASSPLRVGRPPRDRGGVS